MTFRDETPSWSRTPSTEHPRGSGVHLVLLVSVALVACERGTADDDRHGTGSSSESTQPSSHAPPVVEGMADPLPPGPPTQAGIEEGQVPLPSQVGGSDGPQNSSTADSDLRGPRWFRVEADHSTPPASCGDGEVYVPPGRLIFRIARHHPRQAEPEVASGREAVLAQLNLHALGSYEYRSSELPHLGFERRGITKPDGVWNPDFTSQPIALSSEFTFVQTQGLCVRTTETSCGEWAVYSGASVDALQLERNGAEMIRGLWSWSGSPLLRASGCAVESPELPVRPAGLMSIYGFANAASVAAGLQPCYNPRLDWDPASNVGGNRGRPYSNPSWVTNACSGYRLPRALEWSYVAAYLDADWLPTSYTCDVAADCANWDLARGRIGCSSATELAGILDGTPSALGVFHMFGNASEIVDDFHPLRLFEGADGSVDLGIGEYVQLPGALPFRAVAVTMGGHPFASPCEAQPLAFGYIDEATWPWDPGPWEYAGFRLVRNAVVQPEPAIGGENAIEALVPPRDGSEAIESESPSGLPTEAEERQRQSTEDSGEGGR